MWRFSLEKLIAIKCEHYPDSWYVENKEYFSKHGRINDCHLGYHIEGMQEISDHLYQTIDGTDGVLDLQQADIEILDNPVWYYSNSFREAKIKKIVNKEFIANVQYIANHLGWSVDLHEIQRFLNETCEIVNLPMVELEPFPDEDE